MTNIAAGVPAVPGVLLAKPTLLLVANAIDFVGVFSDFSNPILIGFDVRAVMLLPLTKRDPIVLISTSVMET